MFALACEWRPDYATWTLDALPLAVYLVPTSGTMGKEKSRIFVYVRKVVT